VILERHWRTTCYADAMDVHVRCATADDLVAVADLWLRAGGPTRSSSGAAQAMRLIERDPEALLIAVVGESIVGSLVVGWDGWRCHLYRAAVDEEHRRTGIARALMTCACERAAAVGATRIDAMVDVANTGAIEFWETVGFERDHADARWSLTL
jgi:ribosomal protein S18 acetylase RimI-like enzyme